MFIIQTLKSDGFQILTLQLHNCDLRSLPNLSESVFSRLWEGGDNSAQLIYVGGMCRVVSVVMACAKYVIISSY